MRMFANVFVILEGKWKLFKLCIYKSQTWVFSICLDTFEVRYAFRHCLKQETTRFTTFKCHNEPTYILSRKCTNQYYGGPGPCCKVDDLFTYITLDRPDLFAHLKFALHCDDDTYWRPEQVLRWLAAIDNSGMMTFPIIGNGNSNDPKENVWHVKGTYMKRTYCTLQYNIPYNMCLLFY